MSKIEERSIAIKKAKCAENIGGVCIIASRDYIEAVGRYIEAIPGAKTRADAQLLFEVWRRSPEHEFITFGIFTGHAGISGAISMDWKTALSFAMALKVRMDAGAEKTAEGYDSHWLSLASDDQQRELSVLLAERHALHEDGNKKTP